MDGWTLIIFERHQFIILYVKRQKAVKNELRRCLNIASFDKNLRLSPLRSSDLDIIGIFALKKTL